MEDEELRGFTQRDRDMREELHRQLSESVAMQEIQRQMAVERAVLPGANYPAASIRYMYPQTAVSVARRRDLDNPLRDSLMGHHQHVSSFGEDEFRWQREKERAQRAILEAGAMSRMNASTQYPTAVRPVAIPSRPPPAASRMLSLPTNSPSKKEKKEKKSKKSAKKKNRGVEEESPLYRPSKKPKIVPPRVDVAPPIANLKARTTPKAKSKKILTRYSWRELGLGKSSGTPAYNAHQRAEHKRKGLAPSKDVTPLDLAYKIESLRCRSVYLPIDNPVQAFVETKSLDPKVPDAGTSATLGAVDSLNDSDKKKRNYSKSSMKLKLTMGKKGKNDKTDALKPDIAPLLHHALGRLYHTMCRQDADDYAADHRQSNTWTVQDIQNKLSRFRREISDLDEREAKVLKESKMMGATNNVVMEEAYRLLGFVPPEGC